jgi:G3E family GTPase
MELVLISGFLGSGKTTMLLSTIDRIIAMTNKKVVIIKNDFGNVGIDAKVMEKSGLQVRELPSGCICCTLGVDFLETLTTVATEYHPDLVFVEPSGLADPASIITLMKRYKGPKVDRIRVMIIVDAVRFNLISRAMPAPMERQLKIGDVIVINKIDEATKEQIDEVRQAVHKMGLNTKLILASALHRENMDMVANAMVAI